MMCYFEEIKELLYNTRQFIRRIVLNFLGTYSSPSSCVHILNGHMVDWHHDDNSDGERFSKLLFELSKYCDFVNFQDAVKKIENKETVDKPTVAFSFDDGWRDCYTQIAPQLEKYGVNAAFFINPNFVNATESNDVSYIKDFTDNITKSPGKYSLTWMQIKELHNKGFVIGAHTLDHKRIDQINSVELIHQLCDCKNEIEKHIDGPCDYFAIPYGNYKHVSISSINVACDCYKYVFSQCDHKHYFSFEGRVLNRRHFEPFWPIKHVMYFLSANRK